MSDCKAAPKNDGHLGYTDTLMGNRKIKEVIFT